jgi:hypothetical protein
MGTFGNRGIFHPQKEGHSVSTGVCVWMTPEYELLGTRYGQFCSVFLEAAEALLPEAGDWRAKTLIADG